MRFFVGFFWEVVRGESERGAAFFTFIGWDGTGLFRGTAIACVAFSFVSCAIVLLVPSNNAHLFFLKTILQSS